MVDTAKLVALTQGLDEDLLKNFFGILDVPDAMPQVAEQLGFAGGPGGHQAGRGHWPLVESGRATGQVVPAWRRESHFSAATTSEHSTATTEISTHSLMPIGAVWNRRFMIGR